MAHCRFQNTLSALRECDDALSNMDDPMEKLSPSEALAFKKLVAKCRRIADDYEDVSK